MYLLTTELGEWWYTDILTCFLLERFASSREGKTDGIVENDRRGMKRILRRFCFKWFAQEVGHVFLWYFYVTGAFAYLNSNAFYSIARNLCFACVILGMELSNWWFRFSETTVLTIPRPIWLVISVHPLAFLENIVLHVSSGHSQNVPWTILNLGYFPTWSNEIFTEPGSGGDCRHHGFSTKHHLTRTQSACTCMLSHARIDLALAPEWGGPKRPFGFLIDNHHVVEVSDQGVKVNVWAQECESHWK